MFSEPETVHLLPKTAVAFGIVKSVPPSRKKTYDFQPSSIAENGDAITIAGLLNKKETALTYSRAALTDKERVFIGWMYLLLDRKHEWKERGKNKEVAATYLKEALRKEIEFDFDGPRPKPMWLPYYLISSYDLDVAGVRKPLQMMYRCLELKHPPYVDFYKEMLRKEKNPIRALAIAKIAEKRFPTESWFIGTIAEDLFKQKKYAECILYLQSVKKRVKGKVWLGLDARFTLWQAYMETKDYDAAIAEFSAPFTATFFNEDYAPLLRAITLCRQEKWQEAIEVLERIIVGDYRDTNLSYLATYYLILCNLEDGNITRVEQLVAAHPIQDDDYMIYGLPFNYSEDAATIFEKTLKSRSLGGKTLAKLKGMLAYLRYKNLPSQEDRKWGKREMAVVARALQLTKEALEYYPREFAFLALSSNLLRSQGKHDDAMDYKTKGWSKDGYASDLYIEAELADCSDDYIVGYVEKLKKELEARDAYSYYLEGYGFDSDIGALFKRKFYGELAKLYKAVKPYIKDWSRVGEVSEHIGGGGLFEIAYALSEVGDTKSSIFVYEKELETGENSAILNNLALAYEKLNDLRKAKELIQKAKKLAGDDDEIVGRNYARICSGKTKTDPQGKQEAESKPPKRKEKLKFDPQSGVISLGTAKCELPIGSNQYQLCKALFERPIGTWLTETDVVDTFYRGSESKRGFYDAIRLANEKIEQGLKIKKLLVYRAAQVQIRADGLG